MNYNWHWQVLLEAEPGGTGTYLQYLLVGLGWTLATALAAGVIALSVGAVVGATHPELLGTARSLLPRAVLLLPGVGAQGGRLEDLAATFTAGPASALPSASRSVLYADRGAGWQEAAAAEAERLAGELRAVAVAG